MPVGNGVIVAVSAASVEIVRWPAVSAPFALMPRHATPTPAPTVSVKSHTATDAVPEDAIAGNAPSCVVVDEI